MIFDNITSMFATRSNSMQNLPENEIYLPNHSSIKAVMLAFFGYVKKICD